MQGEIADRQAREKTAKCAAWVTGADQWVMQPERRNDPPADGHLGSRKSLQ
jgi:hypothetical protein